MTDPDAARLAAEHFGWKYLPDWRSWDMPAPNFAPGHFTPAIGILSDSQLIISPLAAEAMALELMRSKFGCHCAEYGHTAAQFEWRPNWSVNPLLAAAPDYRLATLRAFAAMKGGEG